MKCPICNNELLEGGIIVDDVACGWVPMEQFKKKGIKRLMYTGMRTIGESSILLNQTKIPNPDKPEKFFLHFLQVSSTMKKNIGGCVHVTHG